MDKTLKALEDSIAHWKKMTKWVGDMSLQGWPVDSREMRRSIGEDWYEQDCSLCGLFIADNCKGCPLAEVDLRCSLIPSTWKKVSTSPDWVEWEYYAQKMIATLQKAKKHYLEGTDEQENRPSDEQNLERDNHQPSDKEYPEEA